MLFPHADVVLPVGAPGVPAACCVALTRTNRETLPKLIERVASHFRRFGPVRASGAEISFEGVPLTIPHARNVDVAIVEATARIDGAIRALPGSARDEADEKLDTAQRSRTRRRG